ncbi:glycoside hydrolase family 5 protein [Phanerochaete sordida]|uniref:glucan 1,3-beta-glucosidase n=1 Tax=Phanerochaete sordida TaxID=48140 RepID=A0A9P3FVM9_9APHY|nr:glycoside hydrolase family 5 protein [Phanerochaete sordida]
MAAATSDFPAHTGDGAHLAPPEMSYVGASPSIPDSARDSFIAGGPATPDMSRPFMTPGASNERIIGTGAAATGRRRWGLIAAGAGVAVVVIVLAIVLPVTLVHHHKNSSSGGSSGSGGDAAAPGPSSNPESPTGALSGGNGTVILTEDGTTFTYINNFGGMWVDDPANPYNNSARAQSYTPALNEEWVWGQDLIRGVNLGGWLITEPFIVPALYEKYQNATPPAVDEWTLSEAMLNDTSPGGGIQQMEDHYKTFITEQDFAQIAGAGLNWVRLPVPFWAIEVWPGEPFLAKTSWTYALKALKWARKYGLRVLLELHTAPGSQNGLNHSGRLGPINFLNGPMGIANAQRTIEYIRVLTEFIAQPEYRDVVQAFGPLNEPLMGIIGRDVLDSFYYETYQLIRNITGVGNGPYIVVHDGFQGLTPWKGFMEGAYGMVLDTHPYVAFGGGLNQPLDYWPPAACRAFQTNQSNFDFGPTITGEFSAAINDCGKWLKNVGANATTTDCGPWDDWPTWTDDMKAGIKSFVMASMDAMHMPGYFFWTWKIGNTTDTGIESSPMWSYQLGLQNGWMPLDPRDAVGTCDTLGVQFNQPFPGDYPSWQTGGSGAGSIFPNATASIEAYPPTLSNAGGANPTLLPQYTDVSANPTLAPATYSGATTTGGNGWADAKDTALAPAPIPGCSYPDEYFAPNTATSLVCGAPAPTARK